ncbi:hypothetical protein Cni_G09480 [Canna indica]|uniref:Uncharacterized protein n=1 Tax=Canna indica TaxID=4628 RepID=A0AAQ3K5Q2_9LILI|nr:hypothetical protein Cni_G09480 [Canna indica]
MHREYHRRGCKSQLLLKCLTKAIHVLRRRLEKKTREKIQVDLLVRVALVVIQDHHPVIQIVKVPLHLVLMLHIHLEHEAITERFDIYIKLDGGWIGCMVKLENTC